MLSYFEKSKSINIEKMTWIQCTLYFEKSFIIPEFAKYLHARENFGTTTSKI